MSTVIDLSQVATQANRELADASAGEIMSWAYEEFGSRLVVTSSLADTVMVHLAEQTAPGIDVIFLDTGYHFTETIGTRDAVAAVHNVNLITLAPKQTVAEQDATWGKDLFARNPDQCCALRKVAPLDGALSRLRRLGQRRPAGRFTGPGQDPDRRLGPASQDDQGGADRPLERPGRGRLHRTELVDDQPAPGRRLRVDRLRAVHGPLDLPGRALGRAGQDRMRNSAVSTELLSAAGRAYSTARPVGATVWLTGLPSSGKSTIAHAVADELIAAGHQVQVLDGDEVRPHLSAGLGYTREARDINVTRIGWVARLLASHGVIVLVPVIAPYADARQAVRADHDAAGVPYGEIFVSTSLPVAESRDVKGLYAKARRGEISSLTGVDDPYEAPTSAELEIDTAVVDLPAAVEATTQLVDQLLTRRPA